MTSTDMISPSSMDILMRLHSAQESNQIGPRAASTSMYQCYEIDFFFIRSHNPGKWIIFPFLTFHEVVAFGEMRQLDLMSLSPLIFKRHSDSMKNDCKHGSPFITWILKTKRFLALCITDALTILCTYCRRSILQRCDQIVETTCD